MRRSAIGYCKDNLMPTNDSAAGDVWKIPEPSLSPKVADATGALELLSDSPAARNHIAAMLRGDGADSRKLAATAARALTLWPAFRVALVEAERSDVRALERRMHSAEFPETLLDPLFESVMRRTVVPDLSIERLVTILRRLYLQRTENPDYRLEGEHLRIVVSLACQCFNNEYIYAVSRIEEEAVERLGSRLRERIADSTCNELAGDLAVYGMYVPLWKLSEGGKLPAILSLGADPYLNELIARQVREPHEEAAIREEIESFGMSEDPVSAAVRRQYEESPYPRWFSLRLKPPVRFSDAITERFPFLCPIETNDPVKILVAGCGTGQHALQVATKYRNADIVAIDFSKASLAHAIRQARRRNLPNIAFRHGDLLCVDRLRTQFDVVEAVGVLHHMADPIAGLKALCAVLRPGGFMKIGLYSTRARQRLSRAKSLAQSHPPGCSPDQLRTMRQEILASGDPIHLTSSDFFYTSGFRDLLRHAHEVGFTPAGLKPILANLGLRFLGYRNVRAGSRAAYRDRFPEDPAMRDLELIDEFESGNPRMFPSLQVFWVRKEGSTGDAARDSESPAPVP